MGRKRGALQTGSSRLNDGDAQIWRQSKEIETMNFVEEIQSCNLVYLLTRLRHFEALFCLFKKCARSPISKYSNSDSFPAGCARSWLVSFCFILFHFVSFCFTLCYTSRLAVFLLPISPSFFLALPLQIDSQLNQS